MPKMREVKRSKNGVVLSTKTGLPKVSKNSSKITTSDNTFVNADGVKMTICKPAPSPKLITARSH